MLRKIITFFISFNLIFSSVLEAVVGINASNRTVEISTDMIKSGNPSDLPVAAVSDFFDKEHIHLVDSFDLSAYEGKKVFVGYGVYDTKEDHCKFLEVPNKTENDYKSKFSFFKRFNQHSYAVSSSRMTYDECKTLANEFGGYPVVIDSSAENMFISANFSGQEIGTAVGNQTIENIWVGAERKSCSEGLYTNELNMNQNYENWKDDLTKSSCSSTTLNVKSDKYGKWTKTDKNIPSFCVVEFNSEDYYKPLKVCAPWWKVIREYPNETPGLYDPNMLKRINQADIPIQLAVCTKYQQQAVDDYNVSTQTRTVQCTEYYSRTIAPECIKDPHQIQCKVNECGGYIQNACKWMKSEKTGKGYVKGEVLLGGVITEVKVKEDITTNEYECPASPVSDKYCLEHSQVMIFPKECPLSNCDGLKACVLAAGSDKAKIQTCYDNPTLQCTKIYGGRDIPPVFNASGEVTHLKGKCPDAPISDGSILEFPVNLQEKIGKKCLEYETFEKKEKITQNCVLDRPYDDFTVDMSITQEDAYENNPDCIRMDTVSDSITTKDISINIKSNGYFKNKITKVYLDGKTESIFDGGSDTYVLSGAMPLVDGFGRQSGSGKVSEPQITNSTTPTGASALDCSEFDPMLDTNGNPTNAWYIKNQKLFFDSIVNPDPGFAKVVYSNNEGSLYVSDSLINSSADCSNYASNHEFDSYKKSATHSIVGVSTDVCNIKLNTVGSDTKFSSIERLPSITITNPDGTTEDVSRMKYTFASAMTEMDCLKKAYCLNGIYTLEGGFCNVTTGEGSPESYEDILNNKDSITSLPTAGTKDASTPTQTFHNVSASFDGVESILVIEDYLRGGWGYYSNYNEWYPLSNELSISSAEFSNKQLFLPAMSRITDYLQYHGIYDHGSYLKKAPDLFGAGVDGAGMGLNNASFAEMVLLSCIIGPVFTLLLIFFSKPKKMDSQKTEYHVYKDIPNELYDSSSFNIYDVRLNGDNARVNEEKSIHSDPSGYKRMSYWHMKSYTGITERGQFMESLNNHLRLKQTLLVGGGVERSEVDRLTHPDEMSINYGYPKCKWYQPWCEKTEMHYAEYVTNNSIIGENVLSPKMPIVYGNAISKEKMNKDTSTIYLGAVNTLNVLVPYLGDYKLEAFNKDGVLISSRIIRENSFANVTDSNMLKSAQVNFALGMNLAPGLTAGDNKNACFKDRAVEWGGGVSGVFFESQRTDLSNYCQKSNNAYVKDQSMTKITIQPLNINKKFEYVLTKPMPFPNRVFISTLDNKEVRKYRCYREWTTCGDDQFKQVKE